MSNVYLILPLHHRVGVCFDEADLKIFAAQCGASLLRRSEYVGEFRQVD